MPLGVVAIGAPAQPSPGNLPPFFYANWPGWFQQVYEAERLVENDPIVQYANSASIAADWREIRAQSQRQGDRLFDVVDSYGWRSGLSVPILGRGGYRAVGSLVGESPDTSPAERTLLHLAVIIAHDQLVEIHRAAAGAKSSAVPSLTSRQTEVLKWLVAGKTNWEISEILMISERTVHFHVNELRRKLAAHNRAQIAAIAISRNLVNV